MLVATVFGLIVTVCIAVGASVWAVSSVKTRNAVLQEALKGLGRSIDLLRITIHQLAGKIENLDDKIDGHADRIATIEARGS